MRRVKQAVLAERVGDILTDLAVPGTGPLMVHSAFAGLSRAGWQPETLIDGLIRARPNGTLAMPAMSWRLVTPANPIFDARSTPSITGVVSEIFRTRIATHRSIHPTHSAAALGPDAAYLTADHTRDPTPCSPNSPFGRVIALDGHILLIGIGLERCTTIHCAEEALVPDLALLPDLETYQGIGLDDREYPVTLRRHVRRPRDFERFRPALLTVPRTRHLMVGSVPFLAFAAEDLDRIVRAAIARDPEATFLRQ